MPSIFSDLTWPTGMPHIELGCVDESKLGTLKAPHDWGAAGDYIRTVGSIVQQHRGDLDQRDNFPHRPANRGSVWAGGCGRNNHAHRQRTPIGLIWGQKVGKQSRVSCGGGGQPWSDGLSCWI